MYKINAKKVVLLACGFNLNVKVYISTTGGTSKGKASQDRETHDFHVRHVDVRDQWDMQVDSCLYKIEIPWRGLGWKYRFESHQDKCALTCQKHNFSILILKCVIQQR